VLGDELLVVGVGRHGDRAGVRHGHRYRAEPDHLANPEPFGQQPNGGDEPFPPQVWFQPGEQQKRRADGVVPRVEAQLGVVVMGEVVGLERHQRPPRPVVQQLVDRERRHQLGVQRVLQVRRGELDGVAGVREPLEGVDQHRATTVCRGQLGRRELQLVHPGLFRLIVLLRAFWVIGHTALPPW
jgi:hypothetical protein